MDEWGPLPNFIYFYCWRVAFGCHVQPFERPDAFNPTIPESPFSHLGELLSAAADTGSRVCIIHRTCPPKDRPDSQSFRNEPYFFSAI